MNRLYASTMTHAMRWLPFRRHSPANAASLCMLLCVAALVGGCNGPDVDPLVDPYTESRITNDTEAAIEVELVFGMNRLFGTKQPESATVEQRLAAFAEGEGVELVSFQPSVLVNSSEKAIAGRYRIEPSGFLIVHASMGTEPNFEFAEMNVTTDGSIQGFHTEEGIKGRFRRGEENRYEFRIGAVDAPATPTHMTQTAFDTAVNEARQDLESRGLEIVADRQGKLSSGKTYTEDISPLDPEWVYHVAVIGDGCFMKLDLRDQHSQPVVVLDLDSSDDSSGPAATFVPTSEPGYKVTVSMVNCPAAECNYALLVIKSDRRAPPQYPPLDMSQITVGPDNTISWDDARTMIKHGNVNYVFQAHSLRVVVSLENGESYQTTEPEIDAVIRWVEECGKKDWIDVMTE